MDRVPTTYGLRHDPSGKIRTPSLRRTFRFALQSIRLRLGRCVVTMASVISAIAFLNYNALFLNEGVVSDSDTAAVSAPMPEGDFFAGLEAFTAERNVREKRLFVIALSVLVCFIGITNSMLMSIKERYREIATLKCLGAINPYIRQLFVIESLLQGAVGSFLGVMLGTVLYGIAAETMAPVLWIVQVNVVCVFVGVVMTLAAAVWPIHEALAMMPIEALRVEE